MMKTKLIIPVLFLGLVVSISSCVKQDSIGIASEGDFSDTTGTLKASASFPIGFGIDYAPFLNNNTYKTIVAREGSSVTFGYQMKHGALVKDDGSVDFTKADALYDASTAAGLEVYGHTLAWYSNQNASYLKLYSGAVVAAATNLLANGNFEAGSGSSFTNWSAYNGASSFSAGSAASEIHGGTRSLKIVVAADNPNGQWKVQMASDLFNTTIGTSYLISFYIKAAAAGGSARLSTGTTAQYQGDQTIGTDWAQINWTILAKDAQTRILFDMGLKANTYYIDDVSVTEVVPAPSATEIAAKLDLALNDFITKTVTHYKGKVKAWDVVNEILADNGSLRTNSNTVTTPADVFVWTNYMGASFGLKAFNYAHTADPSALLFINDYNLESSNAKLDSLIAYVNYLKKNGAQVDGIGTQMHISISTSYAGIDNAFQKLAATGLKIRVSELDVRANPLEKANFLTAFTSYAYIYQAAMYKYVIESYIKNVPAAQRYGVTIWGIDDPNSWIILNQKKVDAPLLFDANFAKKPAYSAVLQALKGS